MTQEQKQAKYKETKEFVCVCCGKTVVATKFASQKTIKCQECKDSGAEIDPEIVEKALAKNPQRARKIAVTHGDTKDLPCINCGKMTTVTKFASAAKVLCPDCKGNGVQTGANAPRIRPDMSKLNRDKLLPIEEYEVNDAVIANGRLRRVVCPSCGHEYMKPLMIIDGSQFGMIIDYQCTICYTRATVSEQTHYRMKHYNPGTTFDYTGRQVKELGMKWIDSSRLANSVCRLIELCEENNIDYEKVLDEESKQLPPYRWLNDRPVPAGFVVPDEDVWAKTVKDAADFIEEHNDLPEACRILDELKNLLQKGDNK